MTICYNKRSNIVITYVELNPPPPGQPLPQTSSPT